MPQSNVATPQQFTVAFVGTAWCIVENRYFLTAHHIFDDRQPRKPNDRFILFFVPNNGPAAFHTPVTGFALEDATNDIAVLEVARIPQQVGNVPAVPVTFQNKPDGSRVLTYGFPSPEISAGRVDLNGNWVTGAMLLKGHANEGLVSGQFDSGIYELNVGWHHGESGGPILYPDPVSGFAIMQTYRGIQIPNGIVYPGPHQGRSLAAISTTLETLGAQVI